MSNCTQRNRWHTSSRDRSLSRCLVVFLCFASRHLPKAVKHLQEQTAHKTRTKKGKTPWQAWVVRCLFCLWFALFCVCFLCLCAVACLKKLEMRSSPNTFFSCKSEKTLHCTFGFNFHYLSLLLPCLPAILACLPSLPAVVLLLCVFFGVL